MCVDPAPAVADARCTARRSGAAWSGELRGQVLSVASTPEHLGKVYLVRNHLILQTLNPAYRMPCKLLQPIDALQKSG